MFGVLAGRTYSDIDFPLSATASSGLPVTFAASGECTVASATVHIVGAGSGTVTAQQAGNASYNPAPDAPQTFTIAKATPVVTITGGDFTYNGQPHPASATATLGGVTVTGSFSLTYNDVSAQPTNAGSYNVVASFTSADTNFASCSGGYTDDEIALSDLSTGATELRYDGTQFIQNWKTPKVSGADLFYRAVVTAKDGSTITAFFKVKRM